MTFLKVRNELDNTYITLEAKGNRVLRIETYRPSEIDKKFTNELVGSICLASGSPMTNDYKSNSIWLAEDDVKLLIKELYKVFQRLKADRQ